MRLIQLGEDQEKAKARFSLMYTAATMGKGPATLEQMRQLTKVQEALEAISEEDTGIARVLREGVTEFLLEDAPYSTLKGRFFGADVPWLPAAARRIQDAYDALDAAKEVAALKVERVAVEPKSAVIHGLGDLLAVDG